MDVAHAPVATAPICLLANPKSGRNSRGRAAIDAALATFGDSARLRMLGEPDETVRIVGEACDDGAEVIVAAGGDGTAVAVAAAMLGRSQAMAVLPLGTFNYFARGLGIDADPAVAARQILDGKRRAISVGMVNGQVFLNNASLGIYPAILRERETVYAHWGRWRLAAHWSVLKTFLKFRRPMRVTLDFGDRKETRRTALVFVARSAFQLDRFGLQGSDAIQDDNLAILVSRAETRVGLLRTTLRLAFGASEIGDDYDLHSAGRLTIEVHRRGSALLAFDGEKRRERSPFTFEMSRKKLTILLPAETPRRAAT